MTTKFPRILIVDDDQILSRTLRLNLTKDGFDVDVAADGRSALQCLETKVPDLIVMDLMLPDAHGFEVSRRVKQYLDVPIIMLTAVGAKDSVAEGLEGYAEDYVVKPFFYRELLARINRVLKRTWNVLPEEQTLVLDSQASIDFAKRTATLDGQVHHLTPTEVRLLAILARNPNRPVATEVLIEEGWPDCDGDPPRLWVNIQRIRRKMERDPKLPQYLITVPNQGYKLVVAKA